MFCSSIILNSTIAKVTVLPHSYPPMIASLLTNLATKIKLEISAYPYLLFPSASTYETRRYKNSSINACRSCIRPHRLVSSEAFSSGS